MGLTEVVHTGAGSERHVAVWVGHHGDLAFHDLHGRPMFVHALLAARQVARPVVVVEPHDLPRVRDVVHRIDPEVPVRSEAHWWETVLAAEPRPVLVHDVLCPLVTADFLTSVEAHADAHPDRGVVAVRPVTDTLKGLVDGLIDTTIDRDQLVGISSPAVVPAGMIEAARATGQQPPFQDFVALVAWLRTRVEVDLMRAPTLGRRVEQARAAHVLECLHEVGHRVRVSRIDNGGRRSSGG